MPDPQPPSTPPGPLRPRPSGITLDEALALLAEDAPALTGTVPDPAGLRLTGASLDSRTVQAGDLYAGLPGANVHGARFAAQAEQAGALAMLTDAAGAALARDLGLTLPVVVVADPRAALGRLAAAVHGTPAGRLAMIGVTGTNGKTTTTSLIHGALTALGRSAGLIGTIETRIGSDTVRAVRTTPESPDLHALLAVMAERGVGTCAMEVSSHALSLHRVDGVVFDVAVFTNLSQDHLDFHATMDAYFAAKASLFTPRFARSAVICIDDDWGVRLARWTTLPTRTLATVPGRDADWTLTRLQPAPDGSGVDFVLQHRDGDRVPLTCPLPGDYNVTNTALAALALHDLTGPPGTGPVGGGPVGGGPLGWDLLRTGLAAAGSVPGRMEVVRPRTADPDAAPFGVVDYAHSPDAIARALASLRRSGDGFVAIVLGAGGDRDRSKRELMGQAAAEGADLVVVTDDNPRSEDPAAIRAQVLAGAHRARRGEGGPGEVVEVGDRRAAIDLAVRRAAEFVGGSGPGPGHPRPSVLLAGKGHETGQEIAGVVHPFDDRVVLAEAMDTVLGEKEMGS